MTDKELDPIAREVAGKTGLAVNRVRKILAEIVAEKGEARPRTAAELRRAIHEGRPGTIWYADKHRNPGKD